MNLMIYLNNLKKDSKDNGMQFSKIFRKLILSRVCELHNHYSLDMKTFF